MVAYLYCHKEKTGHFTFARLLIDASLPTSPPGVLGEIIQFYFFGVKKRFAETFDKAHK